MDFPPRRPRGSPGAGLRIAVGAGGEGTRALALKLLALAGVAPDTLNLVPFGPARGADELMGGRLDADAVAAPADAPAVRRLVAEPDVDPASFRRADAFVALNPFLEKTVLPAGVGNMAKNRPPKDVTLIETKTSLVVRRDSHAALQYLLLEAASEIHGGPGIFHKAGTFPAAEAIDLALSENARQYYRSGGRSCSGTFLLGGRARRARPPRLRADCRHLDPAGAHVTPGLGGRREATCRAALRRAQAARDGARGTSGGRAD